MSVLKLTTKPCPRCNKTEVMSLNREQAMRWMEGALIQDAFPDMSVADRELLMTGTHDACWKEIFPEEELSIKDKVQAEMQRVSAEIDADDDQERATLEGWYDALSWVLQQLEKEESK